MNIKLNLKVMYFLLLLLSIQSCKNSDFSLDNVNENTSNAIKTNHHKCATTQKFLSRRTENIDYKNKSDLWLSHIRNKPITEKMIMEDKNSATKNSSKAYEIRVVVNHLYQYSNYKISNKKAKEILAVTEDCLNKNNLEYDSTPSEFKKKAGSGNFKLVLEKVKYRKVNKKYWKNTDHVKWWSKGGINATDPKKYMNIWVVPALENDYSLGEATFPVDYGEWWDGIVIVRNDFIRGENRTLVHEMGHYFGLFHIWGDDFMEDEDDSSVDYCSGTDWVSDTNNQGKMYYGTISHPQYSCGSKDMFQNFMGYADNQTFFTHGQMLRARQTFWKDWTRPNGMRKSRYPMRAELWQ